jgi:RNA polymerase sigma-70 factor (ECF subfamily)
MGCYPITKGAARVAGSAAKEPRSAHQADRELFDRVKAYLRCRREKVDPPASLAEAWDHFHQELAPRIRSFLGRCHLPESDREDCLQEVWEWLVGHLAQLSYDPRRGRLSTWLMTVARNKAVDRIRRNRQTLTGLGEGVMALADPRPDPADAYDRLWTQARVRAALEELSGQVTKRSYQVLYLRWIEGRTIAEIGEVLGLTPEQVSFRHHRMKSKFRELFQQTLDLDLPGEVVDTDRDFESSRNVAQELRQSCE